MVNPIKGPTPRLSPSSEKKKPTKEIDIRVKKAAKRPKTPLLTKPPISIKASSKISTENALLAAEKAANTAKKNAVAIQRAAVLAQKKAFLAQRAHMAQQAVAAKRASAAAKAKKAAERAARKASTLRKIVKFKAYLAKPEEKKRSKLIKKYFSKFGKKKKKTSEDQ